MCVGGRKGEAVKERQKAGAGSGRGKQLPGALPSPGVRGRGGLRRQAYLICPRSANHIFGTAPGWSSAT